MLQAQLKAVNICVADDVKMNRRGMERQLAMIDPLLQVSVMESAEKVSEHWTEFSILVIDNNFGAGKMTGSELIQLIRNAEKEDDKKKFIILWSADNDLENPGADLMWDKAIAFNDVKAHMLQALRAM